MNATWLPRCKTRLAASVLTGLILGIAPLAAQERNTPKPAAKEIEAVHRLIKPHAGESRWMEIEWYPTVWEARQKAAATGKPLFLWAGSGGAPPAGC